MIRFTTIIKKFDSMGEKTGWSYILIPAALAHQINPGIKKGFRVKGKMDNVVFKMASLLPMGGGDFILTLNAAMRKSIKKQKGASVVVEMEKDSNSLQPPVELIECLADEPNARAHFQSLTTSQRNYFINWITSAKTENTIAKRIASTINAMDKNWDFGQMIRAEKAKANVKNI